MIGPLYDDLSPAETDPPEVVLPPTGDVRDFPELKASTQAPNIRSRLHVICALYAHTDQPDRRLVLLDHLERLTLEAAESLAAHLLASGWRPQASFHDTAPEAA